MWRYNDRSTISKCINIGMGAIGIKGLEEY